MEPKELPKPKPEEPAESSTSNFKISLGPKRYGIRITTESFELKPEPAKVIEFKRPLPPNGSQDH
jgi:hypothetical protein